MAKSMSGASPTCCQAIWMDSRNATSLPVSADGRLPFDWQDGPMTAQSGPVAVLVKRGAWRDTVKVSTIPAIFGQRGSASLKSAILQRSLESRLRATMASSGSISYTPTWKHRVTPSGRLIYQLWVSEHSIEGLDFFSLPTPTATDGKGSSRRLERLGFQKNLRDWFRLRFNFLYPPVNIVRWLMGYPIEWVNCAVLVMPSSRKSHKSSSKRS